MSARCGRPARWARDVNFCDEHRPTYSSRDGESPVIRIWGTYPCDAPAPGGLLSEAITSTGTAATSPAEDIRRGLDSTMLGKPMWEAAAPAPAGGAPHIGPFTRETGLLAVSQPAAGAVPTAGEPEAVTDARLWVERATLLVPKEVVAKLLAYIDAQASRRKNG